MELNSKLVELEEKLQEKEEGKKHALETLKVLMQADTGTKEMGELIHAQTEKLADLIRDYAETYEQYQQELEKATDWTPTPEDVKDDAVEAYKERVFKTLESGDTEAKEDILKATRERLEAQRAQLNQETELDEAEVLSAHIVLSLPFTGDQQDYKEQFQNRLTQAIKYVTNGGAGHAEFLVDVGDEQLRGEIHSTGYETTVKVGEYTYRMTVDNDEEEEYYEDEGLEYCEECGNEYNCYCHDEEDTSTSEAIQDTLCISQGSKEITYSKYCNCSYANKGKSMCDGVCRDNTKLIKDIEDMDEEYYTNVHKVLERIEEELKGKTKFNVGDYRLIQYYLKHQAYNSEDIETLSDNALELAWKYRHYRKGK